ncbi:hypothetical protein EVAR_19222_1 [Eumeta japonica]|uniref:Uncharacterized protein n=1 Tax=Eumeta variegata TaxID=151549 RepID=A0A4C1VEQ7_EUMVA|nr:hypothetical protein EVAR_19222_1 [Eumeta japonica]
MECRQRVIALWIPQGGHFGIGNHINIEHRLDSRTSVNGKERNLDACLRMRDVVCVRGIQQRRKCGALKNSGSNQSLSRYAILILEGEVSGRYVFVDDKDKTVWDLYLVEFIN